MISEDEIDPEFEEELALFKQRLEESSLLNIIKRSYMRFLRSKADKAQEKSQDPAEDDLA